MWQLYNNICQCHIIIQNQHCRYLDHYSYQRLRDALQGQRVDTFCHCLKIHLFLTSDPEKHQKFTQSKFDIFFLHKHLSGCYKGDRGQNERNYTDLKKCTQTWFAGLP